MPAASRPALTSLGPQGAELLGTGHPSAKHGGWYLLGKSWPLSVLCLSCRELVSPVSWPPVLTLAHDLQLSLSYCSFKVFVPWWLWYGVSHPSPSPPHTQGIG